MRFAIFLLALVSSSALAVTLPHSFGPGVRVTNAKLQQNFQALANAITALENGGGALTNAAVVGTYKMESIETFLGGIPGNDAGDTYRHNESRYTGTATFFANQTYTLSLTSNSMHSLVMATLRNDGNHAHSSPEGGSTGNSGDIVDLHDPSIGMNRSTGGETDNGTWAIVNGQVVVTDSDSNVKTLDHIGGKLMIYTESEQSDDAPALGEFFYVTILIKQPTP